MMKKGSNLFLRYILYTVSLTLNGLFKIHRTRGNMVIFQYLNISHKYHNSHAKKIIGSIILYSHIPTF